MTYETNFNFVATGTDGRGNVTTYSYDANGNRTNVINRIPSIVEDLQYNSYGQMTAHTLPDNGSSHRRRDMMTYYSSGPENGYLQSRVVDNSGFNLTTTYQYDGVGNPIRVVDPRGNDSTNIVNALNQVVRQISRPVATATNGPVRYQNDFYYDANDNVVRVDVQNRDDSGAVAASIPAFTTTSTYDILNDVLSRTQEADTNHNVVTAYSYDADQNRILTRFGEATAGRQIDNVVQTTLDERDLTFLEIRAPGSSIQSSTQYDYDSNGNLIRASQGLEDGLHARVTLYAYDGYDRRVTTTDPMGNVTTYDYDANGNRVSSGVDGELVDVPGSVGNTNLTQTTYTYDAMDRRVQTDTAFFNTQTHVNIGGGHAITLTVFSANSQVLTNYDANTNVTISSYDTANRRSLATDAKANTFAYVYDANGNVTSTTETDKSDLGNPNQSFTTTTVYDGLDRVISVSDNMTNTVQSGYDSRNNRVLLTDARGNRIRYTYDGLNRLLQTRPGHEWQRHIHRCR